MTPDERIAELEAEVERLRIENNLTSTVRGMVTSSALSPADAASIVRSVADLAGAGAERRRAEAAEAERDEYRAMVEDVTAERDRIRDEAAAHARRRTAEGLRERNRADRAEAERDALQQRLANLTLRHAFCEECGGTLLGCFAAPVKCCPDCKHPSALAAPAVSPRPGMTVTEAVADALNDHRENTGQITGGTPGRVRDLEAEAGRLRGLQVEHIEESLAGSDALVEALERAESAEAERDALQQRLANVPEERAEAGRRPPMSGNHHHNCFQVRGVPRDLPSDLCGCKTLWMIDGFKFGLRTQRIVEWGIRLSGGNVLLINTVPITDDVRDSQIKAMDDAGHRGDLVFRVRTHTEDSVTEWKDSARQQEPVERITDANGDELERGADTDAQTAQQQDRNDR